MESKTNDPTTHPTSKPEQKKSGLGRGLAALLGGDEDSPFSKKPVEQKAQPVVATQATATIVEQKIDEPTREQVEAGIAGYKILSIPLGKVKANEEQPRQHFSDSKLQELAESICEQGLIQPIIVRAMPDQTYQIVAGERRYRACKMLGMAEIPAIIRDDHAQVDKAELASVIENIQRVELNPIELADAYSKILKNYGFTQEELAKKLGVSRTSVANTLRLQKLPQNIKDYVTQGKLSEGHVRALLTLEKEEDMAALAGESIEQGLNVREVEARVRAKIQGPMLTPNEPTKSLAPTHSGQARENIQKSPELLSAEEELRNLFGTKAVVRGNQKGGVIELFYSNEDSLHRLLHQLRNTKN